MNLAIFFYILLAVTITLLVIGVLIYNSLVDIKHTVSQAWSNIDVLLKQRHDELPKLVETCRQYMRYEQETLSRVMEARTRIASARETGNLPALGAAENVLRAGLGQLYAVSEAYPELRSSEKFQHLQTRITGLENGIADRREYYNEAAKNNNIRIEQFPDILIARWFGFGARSLLEFSDTDKRDPDLNTLFS
ncbi:LemA family protein [Betaproteobacteria bacterium PRO4]|uniref:LemA family protein n=1 Tax=Nitrosomonas sp. TaxID=42353 RepID=UPI0025661EDF|nr:LemA family protein [Nitrosomonas sp.]MBE7527186.1 LemA family protein [Burkholderiales bacterium]MDL1866423.1 LemA family protein [Betaproteobacteria bacterium PRO4]